MLGFADVWIALAYISCIVSALLCAVYGILNWNNGNVPGEDDEVRK